MAPALWSRVPKSWSSADQVIPPESSITLYPLHPLPGFAPTHFSHRMDLSRTCSSLSLLFFFSLHFHFLVPSSGLYRRFLECAPHRCGDQEIGYPFRHVEQPSYCGYPGYELYCDGQNLTLSMESLDYHVIHIDWSTKILEVVRKDLSEDICPQTYVDTTLNFTLFNYTSIDSTSTLFFDCDQFAIPQFYQFSCPASRDGYFALGAAPANPLCNVSVFVPISIGAQDRLRASPLEGGDHSAEIIDALNEGFEITWIANTSRCEICKESGGRCGYDWNQGRFNCFCSNGAYSLTCDGKRIQGMYAYSHPT